MVFIMGNISVGANETDMLITMPDGQVVTITNWYSSYSSRIEQLEFADGTLWQAADIISNMALNSESSPMDSELNLLIQSF